MTTVKVVYDAYPMIPMAWRLKNVRSKKDGLRRMASTIVQNVSDMSKAKELAEQMFPEPQMENYDDILEYRNDRDWTIIARGAVVKGYEQAKQDFIEKACDAYCKVCGHYPHTTPDGCWTKRVCQRRRLLNISRTGCWSLLARQSLNVEWVWLQRIT